MPKEKRTKENRPKGESSSTGKITDPRFKNFEEDPRFRLPSKRASKVKIDKRFSSILKDEDNEFTSIAKVDRYGRKIKADKKKKVLQSLYQAEDEDEEEEEDDNRKADDDDAVRRELRAAKKNYDPARHGGYSSSDDSSDEDEDEDAEEETAAAAGLERFQDDQVDAETGDVTSRFAVVNLDWDHVSSIDLLSLLRSFLPPVGRVEKVTVYPSSFGKERMEREDMEGPPKELFQKAKADSDSDSDESDEEVKNKLLQEEEEEDFNNDALRAYQLERLRYYFAVVEFSDEATAKAVYDSVDGTEYLSSSNFMDLRFIPDDLTFDEEPRDSATEVPTNYKPVDFVTDALFNSKVKLSWDVRQDDSSRNDSIQNAFKGSRSDIADNDLKAYLASDSSDSGDDDDDPLDDPEEKQEGGEEEPRLSKKELARRKMRAALGLPDEPAAKLAKSGPVGDMQITFTSALTDKSSSKKTAEEETTIEKYKRKERERKAKKKEKAVAKRAGVDPSTTEAEPEEAVPEEEPAEDLGFDDPFFASEEPVKPTKSAIRKEERLKKRAAKEAEDAEKAAERANLELIMADNADGTGRLDHFDMNEILRAEKDKKKGKKGKKSKKAREDRGGLQQSFKLDTADSRFQAVFHEHEFAIDPSNPRYKETESMKTLLEEGRGKRKAGSDDMDDGSKKSKKSKGGDRELSGLISSIKKKTKR
ncbi:hypothetical protein GQ53DRAFT_796171 [Thozetella sp. PMI_491]|nr:hypothetical protein GQ53DRAFT_796171 [Thozetella sp. PMI_491]